MGLVQVGDWRLETGGRRRRDHGLFLWNHGVNHVKYCHANGLYRDVGGELSGRQGQTRFILRLRRFTISIFC